MRVSCLPVSATYSWACIQMRRHKEKIAKMQRCMQCAAPVSRVRQVAWVARAREKKIEGRGSWGALALFSLDISRDPPAVRARRRRRPRACDCGHRYRLAVYAQPGWQLMRGLLQPSAPLLAVAVALCRLPSAVCQRALCDLHGAIAHVIGPPRCMLLTQTGPRN